MRGWRWAMSSEESADSGIRDSSPDYIDRPQFDTDRVVDWDCPCCGDAGFDSRRTADYYPLCTNRDCAVKMFTVFRGEHSEVSDG
jgi:hypothetical protein